MAILSVFFSVFDHSVLVLPGVEAMSILAALIWLATGRSVDLATKARAAAAEAV